MQKAVSARKRSKKSKKSANSKAGRSSKKTGPAPKLNSPKFVVGIGASAGGLKPIQEFFTEIPRKTGCAFVIVQHLSADFKSLMGEILARFTSIPIYRAENELKIQTDAIYLIPPKKNMIISNGRLLLTEQPPSPGLNLPIDIFFRALAQECGPRSIGVVLSGTGSDGSRGIDEIKANGGLVLIQDMDSAQFDGMPRSATSTGAADHILPPNEIAKEVVAHVSQRVVRGKKSPEGPQTQEERALRKLFELLKSRYHIEFEHYKPSTIDRRLLRRMAMNLCKDLGEYVDYLRLNPKELDNLFYDFLIGVTRFFRDPKAFDYLLNRVAPSLLRTAGDESRELRVWVPGCATGEEAYSLAILLAECEAKLKCGVNPKIFATDVHKVSLGFAAAGKYPSKSLEDLPKSLVDKYFEFTGQSFQIRPSIRKMVVFANQNVMRDPPFTNMDLISCRNMLIYFQPPIQRKVLSLFHFSLRNKGVLFLGPSENIGTLEDEFCKLSSEYKIFEKLRDVRLADSKPIATAPSFNTVQTLGAFPRRAEGSIPGAIEWAYESLLREYVSAGFLVDENKNLMHAFGDSRKYLQLPEGRPSTNIMAMLPEELRMAFGSAIHRCRENKKPVKCSGIRLRSDPDGPTLSVVASPLLKKSVDRLFLFLNILDEKEKTETIDTISVDVRTSSSKRMNDLESELQFTKESLQATNEELETANEELQASNEELVASNEELQSTNEELQSTNEELQSTNEELHSVNEELHTVNSELQEKVKELAELNSDMENFLRGADIGTIFLDNRLNIRKFTPAVRDTFQVRDRDIGRPIEDISHNLEIDRNELLQIVKKVFKSKQEVLERVGCADGSWYLMRVLPYFDEFKNVNGIIITLVDITVIQRAEVELREYSRKLELSAQDLQDFAYAASHDLQGPMRQIIGFSDSLKERLESSLDEESLDDLQEVVGASKRMKRMLDDLLEFSRIYSRGGKIEVMDCSDVLESALERLENKIRQRGAVVSKTSLPKIPVDNRQMTRVFENLIDNAIKFSESDSPEVNITAKKQRGEWVFSVDDNGIGVPEKFSKDVFTIFRRLHPPNKYEGSGLGLSICKRIVVRHQGRIWMDPNPEGSGCSVKFALPEKPNKLAASKIQ